MIDLDATRPHEPLARTLLFVPGDRPDRFAKAATSGADVVICDLEDSVRPEEKSAARQHVAAWLADGPGGWVRVNSSTTQWFDDDLDAIAGASSLGGVMLPKAESPDGFEDIRARIGPGRGVIALVETAVGIAHSHELARVAAVDRLAFGSVDFALDIDSTESEQALLLARTTLVLASRAAHKPAPIDGVTTALGDVDAVGAAARYARSLGFGGKLCIHPTQLPSVAAAFTPSASDVEWARTVIEAHESAAAGSHTVHGSMIDKPVLDRARRLVNTYARGPRNRDH